MLSWMQHFLVVVHVSCRAFVLGFLLVLFQPGCWGSSHSRLHAEDQAGHVGPAQSQLIGLKRHRAITDGS